jgi:hypothetical protein
MSYELPFDLIELVPCPALSPAPSPGAPLRELAFREDSWLPDEIDRLHAMFAADESVDDIAASLDRGLHGVRSKIAELGLRRHSTRPWTEMDDTYLAQAYGQEATSTIAAAQGRSVAAIYARASFLGLTEGNAPAYTEWEIAQIRAGYAEGVPVAQLGVLIGLPASGIATVASRLGIKHANGPADWSDAEQQRALELAETGIRYAVIAERLEAEGFPRRLGRTVGQTLRRLGYGRGWGRPWLDEENDLIRQSYARGDSLAPLQDRLGRSRASIAHQAGVLGLQGTHIRPNGWRTEPPWTETEIAILRRDYGRVKVKELETSLGRKKGGIYNKAFQLGLNSGYFREFNDDENRAIRIARDHGVSLTDLSAALDREPAVVSKQAIKLGIPFATRVNRAPRGPRRDRSPVTLGGLLAKDAPAVTPPVLLALPDAPSAPQPILRAMHDAGLLRVGASSPGIILLTGTAAS